jgi:hypothetical protein
MLLYRVTKYKRVIESNVESRDFGGLEVVDCSGMRVLFSQNIGFHLSVLYGQRETCDLYCIFNLATLLVASAV